MTAWAGIWDLGGLPYFSWVVLGGMAMGGGFSLLIMLYSGPGGYICRLLCSGRWLDSLWWGFHHARVWYSLDVLRDRQVELAYLGIVMPFSGRIPA